jgi:hypothetical protein
MMSIKFTRFTAVLPLLAIVLILSSCFAARKTKTKVQKVLPAARETAAGDAKKLADLDANRGKKLETGNIDSVISQNVANKVKNYTLRLDSFSNVVNLLTQAVSSRKEYVKNKKTIKGNLEYVKKYLAAAPLRLHKIDMIDEGLLVSQKNEFNLGAFFGPGKYEVPKDKILLAEASFAPVIDSLVLFYNNYNDVDRFATLIILGFADGTGFNPQSEIVKILSDSLHQNNPAKEQLNGELSKLRAQNLGLIMVSILGKKIKTFSAIRDIDFGFIEKGKGEEFPNKSITDYQANDERRRVVQFYWNVLPKE